MTQPLLEIENLSIAFDTLRGRVRAVDDVDLHVARGEAVGLVGESGCGKSLTALSILGLVPSPPAIVESGTIRFSGTQLTGLDSEALRRIRGDRIGMIFQEPMTALNPVLSVGRQLTEALRAHRRLTRHEARRRAIDWLQRVRIAAPQRRLAEYPHQLSGGMRQRVMIAMAMICQPELIIADEPTTALDATLQAQILALMLALKAQMGMALLLISHDMGVIAQATARVVVMYAGQIVENAATATLFRSPFHPYSEGLLASIPRPIQGAYGPAGRLREIRGSVPTLAEVFAGCRFARRCPYAFERCQRHCPPLEEVAPGHCARCWLHRQPERRRLHA